MKSNMIYLFGIIVVLILGIVFLFKKDNYTLTFVVDGNVYKTIDVRKGTTPELIENPTKDDLAFIGWYDENGNSFNTKNAVNDNVIYYARWATIVNDSE